MTNREAHEQAAGMALDDMFFQMNGINPDAEYICFWCNTGHRIEFNLIDDEGNTVVGEDNMVITDIADYCPKCGRSLKHEINFKD
jgi:hypothetical protein